jgi:hypothetical protein
VTSHRWHLAVSGRRITIGTPLAPRLILQMTPSVACAKYRKAVSGGRTANHGKNFLFLGQRVVRRPPATARPTPAPAAQRPRTRRCLACVREPSQTVCCRQYSFFWKSSKHSGAGSGLTILGSSTNAKRIPEKHPSHHDQAPVTHWTMKKCAISMARDDVRNTDT